MYFLALVSGALLALSFPRYGHPAFGWIALVPLLLAVSGWNGHTDRLRGRPPLRAFSLGLLTGLVYFIGTVYWTGTVIATFGEVPTPIAMFAMLLLAAYLALYPAVTALVVARLVSTMGARALLLAPAAWVSTEYLRGWLFGGFPWVPLGNSQVTVLPVAQLASLLGVYGLSLLVAFVNAGVAYALVSTGRSRMRTSASVALVLVVVGGWGALRVREGALLRDGEPVRVGLVQGNIDQADKWKPSEARRIFTTYLAMTRDVVARGAQYVIWPESSTPFMFEEDAVGGAGIRDLARELRVPVLFGSDQIERGGVAKMYNAAFQVAPDGQTAAVYRKMHLVPFGEFIPAKGWLYFVSPLVESLAEFVPGAAMVMLPTRGHLSSTAICYEVVYPALIREAVLNGSELLTTITNDAWYGRSSAPYQHFALASMRAIEQGRYLARAANTGISGVVDPYGRVVRASGVFEQIGMVENVRFIRSRTVYSRIGDVAAYLAMLVTLLALAAGRVSP
jgi:apolipoprotein N-acyltransferase